MKTTERICWLITIVLICITVGFLFSGKRHIHTKEKHNLYDIADVACSFAEANNGNLPKDLTQLIGLFDQRFFLWGVDDLRGRSGLPEIKHPSLLKYAIVIGDQKAIIHQHPKSRREHYIWVELVKHPEGWVIAWDVPKGVKEGSFKEMVTAVSSLNQL